MYVTWRFYSVIFTANLDCSGLSSSTASSPVPPPHSCSVCQRFSYSSALFSNIDTSNKCSPFTALESQVHILEKPASSQAHVAGTAKASIATVSSRPADCPKQSRKRDGWVTVSRKRSPKQRPPYTTTPVCL